ncbi:MAG: hypothetical protein A2161_09855 [Candidatus Schekmanbacteria bacterium RBG_13_48_7]|uniref:Putative mRNA interferase YoeB n=1 Tax=Candidatus Schekmanbacteria bacterium RBG_13_48_7 TaxID=1817878 RepID=A0A1F7RXY3_9BACT|nr:MAG: hypothetical protein A2161_09855 [Candidatus Schekmanbacteria bacterium RBG_13_48_7]
MSWNIKIKQKADLDLTYFRKNNRTYYVKCFDLIRELIIDPRIGTGKPEQLKLFDREVWSRRISHEHRMIYVIYPQERLVEIISCKSHYSGIILKS